VYARNGRAYLSVASLLGATWLDSRAEAHDVLQLEEIKSQSANVDLVRRWEESGGPEWLSAELKLPGGGKEAVETLRLRHLARLQHQLHREDASEQEALVQILPRWFSVLERALAAQREGEHASSRSASTLTLATAQPDHAAGQAPLSMGTPKAPPPQAAATATTH
jgi:hypothetical protein